MYTPRVSLADNLHQYCRDPIIERPNGRLNRRARSDALKADSRCATIRLMNIFEAKLPLDPLAVGQEPTDEQLAEIMDDVARVAREKRAAAELNSRAVLAADLLAAQARTVYQRKQYDLPRL